jgi:NADPH-dependent ferric siderophore reductase
MTAEILYRFARLCEAEARDAADEAQVAVVFHGSRRLAAAWNDRARHLRDLAFAARRRARKLPAGNLQS